MAYFKVCKSPDVLNLYNNFLKYYYYYWWCCVVIFIIIIIITITSDLIRIQKRNSWERPTNLAQTLFLDF